MTSAPTQDPTKRFSNLVDNYVKYRPSYPKAIVGFLREELALSSRHSIADIGSGTGIFTKLLLENGNTVYAVEPNDSMRAAAEKELSSTAEFKSRFHSVVGTAEATTLADHSVDFITCAQAFHWFDAEACRHEFKRILKPAGYVVLIWNTWDMEASEFMRDYKDAIYRYCKTFGDTSHENETNKNKIKTLFAKQGFKEFETSNEQHFDLQGLKGRVFSSSYAPPKGDSAHDQLNAALEKIFNTHAKPNPENGRVIFPYKTRLYYGVL